MQGKIPLAVQLTAETGVWCCTEMRSQDAGSALVRDLVCFRCSLWSGVSIESREIVVDEVEYITVVRGKDLAPEIIHHR